MMLEDFGMMTEPMPEDAIQYDVRAIIAYCREKIFLLRIYQKKN